MYEMSKEKAEFIVNYLLELEFHLTTKQRKTYNARDHIKEAHDAYLRQKS